MAVSIWNRSRVSQLESSDEYEYIYFVKKPYHSGCIYIWESLVTMIALEWFLLSVCHHVFRDEVSIKSFVIDMASPQYVSSNVFKDNIFIWEPCHNSYMYVILLPSLFDVR